MELKDIKNNNCLFAGTSCVDITPKLPAALVGQYYHRLATSVYSKLYANVLAIRCNDDSAVFVSFDWLGVPEEFISYLRKKVQDKLPDFPCDSIIANAIHTHTAPYVTRNHGSRTWGADFDWCQSEQGEITPEEYWETTAQSVSSGIVSAWQNVIPVKFATGFSYSSIGFCRRTVYDDDTAVMYGNTNREDFKGMESSGDCGIHFMTFESEKTGELVAAAIEVPCPSQILEHHSYISSDYWDSVRNKIHDIYGNNVTVLSLCGAAGDLSPRDLVRTAMPEPDMHSTKMYQPEGAEYIAEKIVSSFNKFMKDKKIENINKISHLTKTVDLPLWLVTKEQADTAKYEYAKKRAAHNKMSEFTEPEAYQMSIEAGIYIRWELQQKTKSVETEIHALKIGSATIATNAFELYVEYADRIRSRNGNPNTIIIQLAGGYQGYLPTKNAIDHGGYSALICNGLFGNHGGDKLVETTLNMIEKL